MILRINYSLIVGSVIILFPALTFSQVTDTITIHHKYYSTTFSKFKALSGCCEVLADRDNARL